MRVSVVICTLNRAQSLGETLECLTHQNHPEFEVVVVNGPSTDDTETVLRPWMDRIRYERCPVPNLSVSRNIGIRAAAGDIVAFIDDDALPEFDWLQQALPSFDDPEVAGVGGIVFDHTGLSLQYKFSAANRFAETTARQDVPFDEQCFPGSFEFPYLQGTNALFRRDALLEIGGFDETFDYYLDETDVCCRLVDAGYRLRQLADAPVHHKFLPSGIRDHQRVVTNWSPIMKNQVYFSYRHALEPFSEYDILQHSLAFLEHRVADARFHEHAGRLPKDSANIAAIKCAEAMRIGMQLGYERRHLRLGPVEWPRPSFQRFPTLDLSGRRKITLISSGYTPNMTGGIARFISDLAPALAARGHEVRVITKAVAPSAVDLEQGVWVHRIETPRAGEHGVAPDVLGHVNDFSTAALHEVERIGDWSSHDVVYGPLWDVETIGVVEHALLPVAIHVATPLAVAAEMAGHLHDAGSAAEIRKIMALERRVMDEADLFQANTPAVAATMAELYPGRFESSRWRVVNLGLRDRARSGGVRRRDAEDRPLMVLFVGRFEVRKGIDTFLEAVEMVAPDHDAVQFVAAGEDRPLTPGTAPFGQTWMARHAEDAWVSRVRFAGSVTDDELHDLYDSADVVVLPSRYESFGLVMVEAMMHGRALISCDSSGIREVVRNGVDGVLIPPGDSSALADELRVLLGDAERRLEMGTAARQRFQEVFHVERFADRFERLLACLSLRDVASLDVKPSERVELIRTSVGRPGARLRSGAALVVDLPTAVVARTMVVSATRPSTLTIDGCTLRIESGHVHRVALDPSATKVQLEVIDGELDLGGVVEVGEDAI